MTLFGNGVRRKPVGFAGFGLVNMTAVEDDALDRCYEESGGDPSCYLATCSHY